MVKLDVFSDHVWHVWRICPWVFEIFRGIVSAHKLGPSRVAGVDWDPLTPLDSNCWNLKGCKDTFQVKHNMWTNWMWGMRVCWKMSTPKLWFKFELSGLSQHAPLASTGPLTYKQRETIEEMGTGESFSQNLPNLSKHYLLFLDHALLQGHLFGPNGSDHRRASVTALPIDRTSCI